MKRPGKQRNHLKRDEARAVLDCLHDLASMVQHNDMAQAGSRDALASRLLARLLLLCAAQCGILALTLPPSVRVEQPLPAFSSLVPPYLLAVQKIQPAEALAALQTVPSTPAARPVMRDTTCWLPVQLPMYDRHQEVWMVLGWPITHKGYRATIERTRVMLPFVMDLAGMVIAQAFQHEQSGSSGVGRGPTAALQETHQRIVEVFDTLSHEFRTPLATIKGYTETLLRHPPQMAPEESQEFLQAIRDAENRLEVLTTRMHEVAQLEAGVVQLDVEVIDLPSLVRGTMVAAQQWVPEFLRDKITFHLHVRDTVGNLAQDVPPVTGDARRLREVFEHLLENAVRFSPDGGRIDIVVQPVPPVRLSPPPNPPLPVYLETCVCDYGIGIPAAHLERVFERFHRVDTLLTREGSGLGLGLTICSYLVALHQGRIWAESCPAGGSAFHLWLPLAQPTPTH